MNVVKKIARWLSSWAYATIHIEFVRPTLECEDDDPCVGVVGTVQWELTPFDFRTDYYYLHDTSKVSGEPSKPAL